MIDVNYFVEIYVCARNIYTVYDTIMIQVYSGLFHTNSNTNTNILY